MTSKEKKQYLILAVLIVAIILVVYFNFFKKSSTDIVLNPALEQQNGVATPEPEAFLPYGTNFDTSIFKDPRFKGLNTPSYPQVDRSEIGVVNPFGP